MTNSALNAAVGLAEKNRTLPYELTKAREDVLLTQEQRDKLAAENEATTAAADNTQTDKDLKIIQGWAIQSKMIREDGVVSSNMPALTSTILPQTSIAERGVKWEQEQQTKMSVYATLAKSYRESGTVTWSTGYDGKINAITDIAPTQPGLTKAQELVAIRQERAFDDNMRQHAANSSANMIGLLLSAEESGNITAEDVAKWRSAVDYLNTTSGVVGNPALLPGEVMFDTLPASISKATGTTITGTTVNMAAGTAVALELTDGTHVSAAMIDLVQMDGTWSVTIAPDDIAGLDTVASNITVTLADQTGTLRTDIDTVDIVA